MLSGSNCSQTNIKKSDKSAGFLTSACWLGRTQGGVGMPPLVFWEIYDFPKRVQNIDNVLLCEQN